MNEHHVEPVRGLPQHLPPGEHILWQGGPSAQRLARSAMHIGLVAAWFGAFAAARVISGIASGEAPGPVARAVLWLAVPALLAVLMLSAFAWLVARTTLYTVTNRRVVMRYGVALEKSINLPFRKIAAAGFRVHADGTGDIRLTLVGGERLSWLMTWPHARLAKGSAAPTLRAIPDAEKAAQAIGRALAADAAQPAPVASAAQAAVTRPTRAAVA